MKRNRKTFLKFLLKKYGGLYSEELGIKLSKGDEREIFKWFLASILFGARISETCAKNTYKVFVKYKLLTPERIIKRGFWGLIPLMREGGYTRYDGKTSNKLLLVMRDLIERYDGKITKVHEAARDKRDLEKRIMSLGKGIGPVTCNIFLRELRGIWKKADPEPCELVKLAMRNFGIKDLKKFWKRNRIRGFSFRNLECALLRVGKDFCRRKRCCVCDFSPICKARYQ